MKKPFFTVAICTYNRAKKLKRALDSVVDQKFKDFEVLVIDDGSTDNTATVARNHKINTRYVKQKHKGLGHARHAALKKAKGTWVAFLDDDDKFLPGHLKARHQIIQKNKQVKMLYGGVKVLGSNYVPDFENPKKIIRIDNPKVFLGGTLVINRVLALKIGGFKSVYNSAYPDNFLEIAKKFGLKYKKVKPKTYLYYHEQKSLTARLAKAILKNSKD